MVFLTCPTCGGGGYVQSQLCARCRGFVEVMGPPRPVLAKVTQRRQMPMPAHRSGSLPLRQTGSI
jgi:hypothetical protein